MANLANLLASGDYSDFTLVCKDQEFKVHKSVVCSQSPVIAAALNGDFKEAKTNTFHVVDFDPTIVKYMLDYMYTGKYDIEEAQATYTEIEHVSKESEKGETSQEDAKSNGTTWIYHGLVNCIADYFCVPGLAKMATDTVSELAQKHWSEDAFCDLLYGTYGRIGDKHFNDMLAMRATDHLSELTARGLFDGNDSPSDEMMPTILRHCVLRFNSLENSLEKITSFFSNTAGTRCSCHESRAYVKKSAEGGYKILCRNCQNIRSC